MINQTHKILEEINAIQYKISKNNEESSRLQKRLDVLKESISHIWFDPETEAEYCVHTMDAKVKIGDSWYTAVIYTKNDGDSQIYVRTMGNFKDKFQKK